MDLWSILKARGGRVNGSWVVMIGEGNGVSFKIYLLDVYLSYHPQASITPQKKMVSSKESYWSYPLVLYRDRRRRCWASDPPSPQPPIAKQLRFVQNVSSFTNHIFCFNRSISHTHLIFLPLFVHIWGTLWSTLLELFLPLEAKTGHLNKLCPYFLPHT